MSIRCSLDTGQIFLEKLKKTKIGKEKKKKKGKERGKRKEAGKEKESGNILDL